MQPDILQAAFSEAVSDSLTSILERYWGHIEDELSAAIEEYQQQNGLSEPFNLFKLTEHLVEQVAQAVIAPPESRVNVLNYRLHPVYHEPELTVRQDWFSAFHEMIQMWGETSRQGTTKITSRWADLHAQIEMLQVGQTYTFVNNDFQTLKRARAAIYKRYPISTRIDGNRLFITKKEQV